MIYHFHGQEKLVNWLVKKLNAVKSQLDPVSKCLKQVFEKIFIRLSFVFAGS